MATATKVEHCTIADIGLQITGEDAEPVIAVVNSYLTSFAKPIERGRDIVCLHCNAELSGLMGSFAFGLVSGEGKCRVCNWPCRAVHNPKSDSDSLFYLPFRFILQYHPDFVEEKTDGTNS